MGGVWQREGSALFLHSMLMMACTTLMQSSRFIEVVVSEVIYAG